MVTYDSIGPAYQRTWPWWVHQGCPRWEPAKEEKFRPEVGCPAVGSNGQRRTSPLQWQDGNVTELALIEDVFKKKKYQLDVIENILQNKEVTSGKIPGKSVCATKMKNYNFRNHGICSHLHLDLPTSVFIKSLEFTFYSRWWFSNLHFQLWFLLWAPSTSI